MGKNEFEYNARTTGRQQYQPTPKANLVLAASFWRTFASTTMSCCSCSFSVSCEGTIKDKSGQDDKLLMFGVGAVSRCPCWSRWQRNGRQLGKRERDREKRHDKLSMIEQQATRGILPSPRAGEPAACDCRTTFGRTMMPRV